MTKAAPSPRAGRWRRRMSRPGAAAALVVLGAAAGAAAAGPWLTEGHWNAMTSPPRLPPGAVGHLLGTDDLGRDMATRLLRGARYTLATGAGAIGLAAAVGGTVGLAAGLAGGWFNAIAMRAADLLLAFPTVLMALAVVATLGFSLPNVALAVGLAYAPQFARVARGAAAGQAALDYVAAARAVGCGPVRLVTVHLLPNCAGPLVVLASAALAQAMLECAALSFLGLGAQPPLPEWGRMLNDGRSAFLTHPHLTLVPGAALAITALSVNVAGDAVRDVLDRGE